MITSSKFMCTVPGKAAKLWHSSLIYSTALHCASFSSSSSQVFNIRRPWRRAGSPRPLKIRHERLMIWCLRLMPVPCPNQQASKIDIVCEGTSASAIFVPGRHWDLAAVQDFCAQGAQTLDSPALNGKGT